MLGAASAAATTSAAVSATAATASATTAAAAATASATSAGLFGVGAFVGNASWLKFDFFFVVVLRGRGWSGGCGPLGFWGLVVSHVLRSFAVIFFFAIFIGLIIRFCFGFNFNGFFF